MGRNGTGVTAVSKKSIEITFTYLGKRCRERIKLAPTAANLKRAQQHRAAVLDSIQKGTFNYRTTFPDSKNAEQFVERKGEILTVERYLDGWLERQRPQLKASTYEGYRKIVLNHLTPAFRTYTLAALDRPAIRDHCRNLKVGAKSVKNRLSVLRAALTDAVTDNLIDTNPLYGWSFTPPSSKRIMEDHDEVIDPLTADEQASILAVATGQERHLFQFALWAGMRTSEIIALEWRDVDVSKGVIKVRRVLTSAGISSGVGAEIPKTSASRRNIKLLAPAGAALELQREFTGAANRYVFHNPRTNRRWGGDKTIREAWKKITKAASVRYRYPYQTRHTYASMMLTAGEPPMWVAQQMGHEDWTMISRTYGKWIKDALPEVGNKAVMLFGTISP